MKIAENIENDLTFAWHARGHRFDPDILHTTMIKVSVSWEALTIFNWFELCLNKVYLFS